MEELHNLILQMVYSLVDDKEFVLVTMDRNQQGTVFIITVKQGQQGQVVGKNGTIANAIRVLIRSIAQKEQLGKVFFEVNPKGLDTQSS